MEQVEFKRKVFDIIEQLGERSHKVERKGNFYFMKCFGDNKKEFESFLDQAHKIKVSGVCAPKLYMFDKETRTVIIDFINGINPFNLLLENQKLEEPIYEEMFKQFWYAKADKFALDIMPDNFLYSNGKLYYIPFKVKTYEGQDKFLKEEVRYWFYSKQFVDYAESKGIEADRSKIPAEYPLNKEITLMSVKYFR